MVGYIATTVICRRIICMCVEVGNMLCATVVYRHLIKYETENQ